MTEPAAPRDLRPVAHISTLWSWLFVGLLAVAIVVGVVGRVFSPAVVLDLVSFWPFLIVIFLIAATVLPRSRGRWLASLVPLLLIGWLLTVIALHLAQWDQLPSTAGRLAGPIHVGSADFTADLPGLVTVVGASSQPEAYLVTPRRAGGDIGAPEALERQVDQVLSVALRPTETSRWFRSEGWTVSLDDRIVWTMTITASDVELDASGLDIASLSLTGNGSILLGASNESLVDVELAGNVSVVVSEQSIVRIIGDASVPSAYMPTEDGFISAEGDPDVVITVMSGSVSVGSGGS